MRQKIWTLALVLCAFAALAPGATATSSPANWLKEGPHAGALATALAEHPHKVPSELRERLAFATRAGGDLRVMVALKKRDPLLEAWVTENTNALQWYGEAPRFVALVDQGDFASLLSSPAVSFIEPDYPLTYFLATSVVDISARGPRGVWNFNPSVKPVGRLSSRTKGLVAGNATGKGVTVAVVDSGIDKTHRDFGGWDCDPGIYQPCKSRIVKSVATEHVLGSALSDPGDDLPTTEVFSGHGTHVAGIVAGNGYYARTGEASEELYGGDGYNIGVAPQASLVSVKVGDSISAALGTMALQWTLDHAKKYDIRVANNSWGCGGCQYEPESVLAQIQKDLFQEGVVTIFAAGNGGGDGSGLQFSGSSQSPYVLSVASYDDENEELAPNSGRGHRGSELVDPRRWNPEHERYASRRPDVAAPGYWIHSATALTGGTSAGSPRVNPGDVGQDPDLWSYHGGGGTSMATPHVSGAAALMFSACPKARPLDVMRAVLVGADRKKVLATGEKRPAKPFEVGYGSLNVRASLQWLLRQPSC